MTTEKWAAEWTGAGGWLVYLGTKPGEYHDVRLTPEREDNAKLAAKARTLRDTLEGHSVVLMGSNSPFWRCQFCDVTQTSPANFPHKPDCLLHYEFTYDEKDAGGSA